MAVVEGPGREITCTEIRYYPESLSHLTMCDISAMGTKWLVICYTNLKPISRSVLNNVSNASYNELAFESF